MSDLEDVVLRALLSAGAPPPHVNEFVIDGIRCDFHWPDARVCVEVDGPGHDRPRTRIIDAERDAGLHAAGWTVVRIRFDAVNHGIHHTLAALGCA